MKCKNVLILLRNKYLVLQSKLIRLTYYIIRSENNLIFFYLKSMIYRTKNALFITILCALLIMFYNTILFVHILNEECEIVES